MDKNKLKKNISRATKLINQRKVINTIIIILFLLILISSSWMRFQNLPLLKDKTTDEYIPLALDPYYFLRLSETLLEHGEYPEYDQMRYPSLKVGFIHEILPQTIVFMYKIAKIFNQDITIQYINVISPVIFFIFGLISFFFLIYFITNSKLTALISTGFLAFIPSYIYRTISGFSDHESIGMLAFFTTLAIYTLSLNIIQKKSNLLKPTLLAILTGLLTAITFLAWSGVAKFILLIIPLSIGIIWLIKSQKNKHNILKEYLLFYTTWLITSILFSFLFNFQQIFIGNILSSSGIITLFILAFITIDFLLIYYKEKISKIYNIYNLRIIWTIILTALIGIITLFIIGKNPFQLAMEIFQRLLTPFGESRVGLTVAENKQPFLMDWINQTGKTFFWLFYSGLILIGANLSRIVKNKKNKIILPLLWIVMISGILFSRISPESILNGENPLSQAIYFISISTFLIYSIWIYFTDKTSIKNSTAIIIAWTFISLIAVRSAARLFFVITPLVCFISGYTIQNLFIYYKKNKEELMKMLLAIGIILGIAIIALNLYTFITVAKQQTKYTSPSANEQWQNSMEWVRTNTTQGEIFVHWWDYGYWVEYLGQRPSVTDGGHANGYWDHLIGRYVLTTPKPETALSFMKAHNVSYLLIDPTDIGKYPAYSSIGSDEKRKDRYSYIATMLLNPQQTQETRNTTTMIYQGAIPVDTDIIYKEDNKTTFLPEEKSILAGIILKKEKDGFLQPHGVFIYNQNRIEIPLRYIYYNQQLFDFEKGINSTIILIPKLGYSGQKGVKIEQMGALLYLSPKNMNSLFAQVYLMNDTFGRYPSLELKHSEQEPIGVVLNMQGVNSEFFYYNGVKGPIKIWKVNHEDRIIAREEFLRKSGDYAEFDNLTFIEEN